ncbi:glutamate racemase, partial [Vibrio parahaemolyticus]|uniref:glutamate racemase n=1 Tax=Vibrio parahaemolyticus TaxID=670 RepID=UPI001ACA672C|nr:hypothetical protein [Vibrio parahaemolyticus]
TLRFQPERRALQFATWVALDRAHRNVLKPIFLRAMTQGLPIGIFDSGVGGLTVYRALHERLPDERFVYLGDTARVPYGTKSLATVERYAV